jgi:hypothetical protein
MLYLGSSRRFEPKLSRLGTTRGLTPGQVRSGRDLVGFRVVLRV